MKSFFIASVLILFTATLNASNISASTISTSTYEFQSFIGVPCGSGLPSDLCTSSGDAIVLTKSLLAQYSAQGWQLLSTTPLFYGSNNEGVAFLMGYNPRSTVPVKPCSSRSSWQRAAVRIRAVFLLVYARRTGHAWKRC